MYISFTIIPLYLEQQLNVYRTLRLQWRVGKSFKNYIEYICSVDFNFNCNFDHKIGASNASEYLNYDGLIVKSTVHCFQNGSIIPPKLQFFNVTHFPILDICSVQCGPYLSQSLCYCPPPLPIKVLVDQHWEGSPEYPISDFYLILI